MRSLSIVFKNCLQTVIFSNNWKKSNVVPIHKKGDKQLLQNYRLVLLLPVCSKIFERILFNPMFEFLEENNLCPHQSGFCSSDSCQGQLKNYSDLLLHPYKHTRHKPNFDQIKV